MSGQSEKKAADLRLGVIGVGVMGAALLRGLVEAGVVEPRNVTAYDADARRLAEVAGELGASAAAGNEAVVDGSEVVLLAVKPQALAEVMVPLAPHWRAGQLLVSIAAGVTLERLRGLTRADMAVARVMPNVACLVRAGASGVAFCEATSAEQRELVRRMLAAVGSVVDVEEKLMDAVTGLSGSGPAFVAMVIEALADGGVAAGLRRDQALALAAQTVMGAGKYVLEREEDPTLLKDRVCSPGGTTIAGVRVLEASGLRSALIEAVVRAAERSRELGKS
jgi:pyrroline-5-carboxylate reductase